MTQIYGPVRPKDSSPTRQSRWENEGGAVIPPAHVAAAAIRTSRAGPAQQSRPEQPHLYLDLLAEADRQRRAADDLMVRGLRAVRDPPR